MTAAVQLLRVPSNGSGHHTPDSRERAFSVVLDGLMMGYTRIEACQRAGVSNKTLAEWVLKYPEMGERYARARAEQAHVIADQALMIADEPAFTMEAVQRNRLRVDTRKWAASKLLPRVYGERITSEHTHRVGVVMLPAIGTADPQSSAPLADGED